MHCKYLSHLSTMISFHFNILLFFAQNIGLQRKLKGRDDAEELKFSFILRVLMIAYKIKFKKKVGNREALLDHLITQSM